MSNHKYEQIPLNEEMQGANSHQRSALEASFDINEDEDAQEAQPMLQQQAQQHMAPPPQSTDGVFSNMSAKPESESTKNEEALPVLLLGYINLKIK
jgi:hypothetical protein